MSKPTCGGCILKGEKQNQQTSILGSFHGLLKHILLVVGDHIWRSWYRHVINRFGEPGHYQSDPEVLGNEVIGTCLPFWQNQVPNLIMEIRLLLPKVYGPMAEQKSPFICDTSWLGGFSGGWKLCNDWIFIIFVKPEPRTTLFTWAETIVLRHPLPSFLEFPEITPDAAGIFFWISMRPQPCVSQNSMP